MQAFSVTAINMSKLNIPSENLGTLPVILSGNPKDQKQGIIVLQEWWGLNQQIQEEAQMLADMGKFVTIVPDLYRGKVRLVYFLLFCCSCC
jgi:carboxymethylenebutenolidase